MRARRLRPQSLNASIPCCATMQRWAGLRRAAARLHCRYPKGGMMVADLLRLAIADAALVFASFIALWFVSMVLRDSSLVDIWFAPCIAAAATVGFLIGSGAEPRRLLLMVLAIIWAVRLGGYLLWRNWGREDPRYARLRKHVEGNRGGLARPRMPRIDPLQRSLGAVAMRPA